MNSNYTKFILYIIIIILINLISQNYFFKIDMTKTKMYSLSKKSKEVVENLKEPLTIKCFFSKDLPPPYNTIKRYLLDLLEEYSQYSNNNFNYEFYTPSENNKYGKIAQSYGISPVKVQIIQKDELKYKSVYMGIVLLHGDAMEKIPVINTTNRLEYLLTTSMEKLINKVSYLLALKGNIHIVFYLSPDLLKIAPLLNLNGLSAYPEKIQNIVKDLNKKYYGKLKYEFIKLKVSENNEKELSKKGIQILKWPGNQKEKIEPGSGGIGLILRFNKQSIPITMLRAINLPLVGTQYILTQPDELKDFIETAIGSLLHINQAIGYLVDHNTVPLFGSPFDSSSSASNFRQLLSQGYDINEIQLNKPIPPGIGTLIIAGPKKKFSNYELYLLDQALMHGTNLAIFLDPYIQEGRSGYLSKNITGLEKLLAYYGIKIQPEIVMDLNCFKQKISPQQGGGERPIYFAPIIKSKNINHSLEFMKNINGLVMLKNAPIYIDKSLKKSAKILFTSSKNSWVSKGNISLNPMYIFPPKKDKMKKYPLAYLIQGKFKSYFINKKIPLPEIKKQKNKPLNKQVAQIKNIKSEFQKLDKGYGKIFIIGSSDIITNSIIDQQGDTPNSIFIMNVIDVLNNKIDRAILRSKIEEFNPLYDISDSTKLYIKTFNIIGLPILVIFLGIIINIYRRRQKNKIKSNFLIN